MLKSIADVGRQISEAEIKVFERKNAVSLPKDYIKFLLKSNGGMPSPDAFPLVGHREDATDVQVFYRLDDGIEVSQLQYNFDFHKENFDEPAFLNLFPFATDSFGDPICFDLSEERYGAVVFFDLVPMWKDHSEKDLYVIAQSFTEFLDMLYEPEDDV